MDLSLAEVGVAVGTGRSNISRAEAGRALGPELMTTLVDFYISMGVEFGAGGGVKLLP